MNSSNAKIYLPLVQALAEGKVVQYKLGEDGWSTGGDVDFSLPADHYRIKPEPRDIFVVIDKDNDGSHLAFHLEEEAIKDAAGKYEVRHYREVI